MPENRHTMDELRILQSLPLDVKIQKTRLRIREWINEFGEDGVYIAYSGGKDSTVLMDIVRKIFPNVVAVFVDTGLENPSVRKFAMSKENVIVLRPKMNFREVIAKYGYPIISKEVSLKVKEVRKCPNGYALKSFNGDRADTPYDYSRYSFLISAPFGISDICCNVMKKSPSKQFEKKCGKTAITAQMTEESYARRTEWIKNGCNAFLKKRPISNPMSFWTEKDVLTYIHTTLPLQTFTDKWLLKAQRTVRLA